MDSKVIILSIILFLQILRGIYRSFQGKDIKYLFVSLYIISIPFQFSLPVYSPLTESMSGTLGAKLSISFALILAIVLFPLQKIYKDLTPIRWSSTSSLLSMLVLISLLNFLNQNILGTLIFVLFIFSHVFLYKMIATYVNYYEIIKGVFEGLLFLCIVQFALAICFPLMGMKIVTEIFHATGAENATRMDTRSGAIGVFSHPGNLALFTIMASIFFLSSMMKKHKENISRLILLLNLGTIILTYSRTAYLVFFVSILFTYIVYKKPNVSIFSFSNLIKFIIPIFIIFSYLIFFSPLSEVFLKSDSDEQIDNRLVHWMMAYEAFTASPLFGVGLNAHLEYFTKNSSVLNLDSLVEFFLQNPIHNIHLIVLAETGIVGISIWFVFIARNIINSKKGLMIKKNEIFCATNIGVIVAICLYGITGWAPLSQSILPFLLFFSYFGLIHTKSYVKVLNGSRIREEEYILFQKTVLNNNSSLERINLANKMTL